MYLDGDFQNIPPPKKNGTMSEGDTIMHGAIGNVDRSHF